MGVHCRFANHLGFASLTLGHCLLLLSGVGLSAAEVGYQANQSVGAATRIDFVFPLANQSPAETPEGWLDDYDSTRQTYERYVPPQYDAGRSWPLVLFISPGNKGAGWSGFRQACEQQGILFAGPHAAGNNCPMRERMRIALDVLDDMRRRYHIDPDRTYLAGFSGGGRVAAGIAFSLPEYVGGVIPICAGADLREEPWLRHRAIDRLSVAHVTGDGDFNQPEVQLFRQLQLSGVGVRARVWNVPKLGHSVPRDATLGEALRWLEEGLPQRQALAKQFPASRVPANTAPARQEQAAALLAEGKQRLLRPETLYSGLMQLQGLSVRWHDLPEATAAKKVLTEYEARAERPWEADDIAMQRTFLIARARALDAYGNADLPKQYIAQRPAMLQAAAALWQLVIQDGQDQAAVKEAEARLPVIQEKLTKLKPPE